MRTAIRIQNLKCSGCAATIRSKISTFSTINTIEINIETSEVSFDYTATKDIALVKSKLTQLGYPPVGLDNSLRTKATSFISCAIGKTI